MMNPPFVKYLMALLGVKEPKLRFEETNMAAYERRPRGHYPHDGRKMNLGQN